MSIIVFAESSEQQYKKSSLEAVSFAKELSINAGGPVIAVSFGNVTNPEILGKHGADEVITVSGTDNFDAQIFSGLLTQVCKANNAHIVVISNTYNGKSIAGRLAVALGAGIATNIIDYPTTDGGFKVKRSVFSGKAYAWVNLESPIKILAITPNSFETKTFDNTAVIKDAGSHASSIASGTKVQSQNKITGKIVLTEAEIVVSGGRGMKGPENWGLIEELADLLGAATACSKPVSDMAWRPHSEHVGQTGITIKPNLYIAIGISGAIQHLAGVSSSKVIVAINKDPEAPFFKAADYGIVGDAFEVLPKLIKAAKTLKAG